MNSKQKKTLLALRLILLCIIIVCLNINCSAKKIKTSERGRLKNARTQRSKNPYQQKMCVPSDETVRARRKSCLLRPDTGPCRADIVSWYYDAKQSQCFRFFWGGCQGNGNRYSTKQDCLNYCYINTTMKVSQIPHYCSLAFDFGTCFGQYNRWGWDPLYKTCRRRLYSGCGGNQNNFETKHECMANCLIPPNNTMDRFQQYTTCIPFTIADLQ